MLLYNVPFRNNKRKVKRKENRTLVADSLSYNDNYYAKPAAKGNIVRSPIAPFISRLKGMKEIEEKWPT